MTQTGVWNRLLAEITVFASAGLRKGFNLAREGSEKPPHDQAPVFNTYKGLSASHLSKKRRINRHRFFDPPNEAEGMPFLLISRVEMSFIEVSGYIRIRAINVILPGFKEYWWKGYKWRYLKQREIRLFGLMAERLFLDPIGYGNELKYG